MDIQWYIMYPNVIQYLWGILQSDRYAYYQLSSYVILYIMKSIIFLLYGQTNYLEYADKEVGKQYIKMLNDDTKYRKSCNIKIYITCTTRVESSKLQRS